MPEWADEGNDPHRGPVTAADIEAERQRMQAQWKAQKEAAERARHGEAHPYPDERHAPRGRQVRSPLWLQLPAGPGYCWERVAMELMRAGVVN